MGAAVLLAGCASDAFTDKHDGQGMRGWAGIPLKDTIPAGLNAMAATAQEQAAQSQERAAQAQERAAIIQASQPQKIDVYVY